MILQFWRHAWSGMASVAVDGVAQDVDLYSPCEGFRHVVADGLEDGRHRVMVTATGERGPAAQDAQVVLHHVLTGRTAPR